MMGKTERVILLKGDATKWYNQAIFIVNQDTPAGKMPVDFVAEAEKIINNYMTKEKKKPATAIPMQKAAAVPHPPQRAASTTTRPAAPKKKGAFDITLNIMMILACIAIVAVFVYGMMM